MIAGGRWLETRIRRRFIALGPKSRIALTCRKAAGYHHALALNRTNSGPVEVAAKADRPANYGTLQF
jgi:hypothetical protein